MKTNGMTRRTFIKGSSALLGGSMLAKAIDLSASMEAQAAEVTNKYPFNQAVNNVYSSCLQCNTGCGIKVKIQDGIVVKIDGNPYNPFNMVPHINYGTNPSDAAKLDAGLCPKGQAGVQTMYDPYRLVKVLKRVGKRGEGKWQTIPFQKAIDEIVSGGKLFANVPGEENRNVEGLDKLFALRDPAIAKTLSEDIKKFLSNKDKKNALKDFKEKNKDNLKYLIDPEKPDLGIKNNQLVYLWGRKKGGRSEFFKRFFNESFGSVNGHGHTTVCQGSLYFGCKALSEQYQYDRFSGGKKFYFQADLEHAQYVLFVGANLFDANYGPTNRSARLTGRLAQKEVRIAVADPRFSKLAGKAEKYLPVNPGTDGALFGAIIRRLIETNGYNKTFLSSANKAAANAAGEVTWTNSPLLVKIENGVPGGFLRAHEIGLKNSETVKDSTGKEHKLEYLVAMQNGKPVAVDPANVADKTAVSGDLFVDTVMKSADGKDLKVKSALQIVKEGAFEKSMKSWSSECGVPEKDIIYVADNLAKYGKKSCVDIHRGVSQHSNGFYGVVSAMTINMLLGNFDHKGGMIALSAYNFTGGKESQPFNYGKISGHKIAGCGISNIRHGVKYEDSSLFNGYPAKRNWWPHASDVYQEVIPSIGDAYPYPVKALFLYMGTPNYSLPAGDQNSKILADVNKLPLFVTTDIVVGPASTFADYIFPDITYLERWEFHGSHPNMAVKVQPIRQPVAAPLTETVTVFGQSMPCSFEATLMAFAEKMKMPGFGPGAFGSGMDFIRPDDLYVRFALNVATDGTPVPDASEEEIELFINSRKHLPKIVFDAERWQKIAGAGWPKLVYVLNRGGRFQAYEDVFKNEIVANPYKSLINMYQERTAGANNAFTGAPMIGYAKYVPVVSALGKDFASLGMEKGYDLHLITQKNVEMTKSRTVTDYWLTDLFPENYIIINPIDAKKLSLSNGDKARISSATNIKGEWELPGGKPVGIVGAVKVTESIKPGVVTFNIGYGQWASGARDIVIDGSVVKGDERRGKGFNANAAMWVEPHLKNTCVIDPVGGSAAFYDTKVKVEKI